MRITAFNGSPKAERSNTHLMVAEFLAGAREAGAEVENIFLAQRNIGHCLGCFQCWTATPGRCVLADDMAELLDRFLDCDAVVFATPVYVDNVTGIMKNFIDRLLPLLDPHFEKDEEGVWRHKMRYEKYPGIIVISNCGFPEQDHFQVLRLLFRRLARNMHSEVMAEIYRGGGEILGSGSLLLRIPIGRYKRLLRRAGGEVATSSRLSAETAARLEKPIIPHEHYVKGANKHWDACLSKLPG
jgi:multimeric flavodoxin WrbA